ncbi:MAG: AsnC family protein [Thaumarchaeota archaeon]|nr:AsnC family protein [Nitrososphaerota archaeon]MCL5318634.1 AsnC family protein [Nitrososphaerota archaeon]
MDEKEITRMTVLIEAMMNFGVENISVLARSTGIPKETVRYKVRTQFPRHGLNPQVSINCEKIGLSRKIVTLTFSKRCANRASTALEQMSKHLYATYLGKTQGSRIYTLMLTVPFNVWKEYGDFIMALSEKGIVESLDFKDISWYRHVPLRTDLYDFRKGEWAFEWSKVNEFARLLPTPTPSHLYESMTLSAVEKPDHIDLAILSEIQKNATLPITKIASNIGVKEDVASYHYTEHVKKRGLISQYIMGWVGAGSKYNNETVTQMLFTLHEADEEEAARVRLTFNKIPFSWMELFGKNGNYHVFASIPTSHFNSTMHYIDINTMCLEDNLEANIMDPYWSAGFPLPLEMFDKKKGWVFNKARVLSDFESFFR